MSKYLLVICCFSLIGCAMGSGDGSHPEFNPTEHMLSLNGDVTFDGMPAVQVKLVAVSLMSEDRPTVDEVLSSEDGSFTLMVPEEGSYSIYAERITDGGYHVTKIEDLQVYEPAYIGELELEFIADGPQDQEEGTYGTVQAALTPGCHCHDSKGFWQQICCGFYSKEYGKSLLWCLKGPKICFNKNF